jgi:glucan phosphoethanolaminetransferase (alkaline phosphatase superfamily)
LREALAFVAVSLVCALLGAVYELFSHEVYSYYMIYAFVLPLALGALPNLVIELRGLRPPSRSAANVWNSGVATLVVGSMFRGALDIYGTTSGFVVIYLIVGAILLGGGMLLCLLGKHAV